MGIAWKVAHYSYHSNRAGCMLLMDSWHSMKGGTLFLSLQSSRHQLYVVAQAKISQRLLIDSPGPEPLCPLTTISFSSSR